MGTFSKLISQKPKAPPSVSFTSRGEQLVFSDGCSKFVVGCVWGGVRNDCLILIASSVHHLTDGKKAAAPLTDGEQGIIAHKAKQVLESAGHSYRIVVARQ
jgi:hypothetical protein